MGRCKSEREGESETWHAVCSAIVSARELDRIQGALGCNADPPPKGASIEDQGVEIDGGSELLRSMAARGVRAVAHLDPRRSVELSSSRVTWSAERPEKRLSVTTWVRVTGRVS